MARGHEKCAAAHGRIDDAELENALGRNAVNQRSERLPNEVFGDRLRRIERAGCLADTRPGLQDYRRRSPWSVGLMVGCRLIIEQRFVHSAQLLDPEITI